MPHYKSRSPIPVVSDLEALEHARSCMAALAGSREGDPASRLDSRALSELDRLIDRVRQVRYPSGFHMRTQAERIAKGMPLKHGPFGAGGDGPCEPDCLKCQRDREAKS